MVRLSRLAVALVLLAGPALADDPMLPAYAPKPGTVWTVRSTTTVSTVFDGTGAVAAGDHTDRLALVHTQEAAEKAGDLWREVWTLDVDGAAVAAAPRDGSPADPHAAYRRSLAMWSVSKLEIETDATGMARKLLGADAIGRTVDAALAQAFPPSAGSPPPKIPIVEAFRADPRMLIDVLIPEQRALAALQTAAPQPVAVGRTWSTDGRDMVAGAALDKKTTFTVEAVDAAAATVTVAWVDAFDPAALAKAFAPLLDQNLAGVTAAKGEPTAEARKALTTASVDNHGRVVLSLADGTTRRAEWTRAGRFGDLATRIETTVTRDPK